MVFDIRHKRRAWDRLLLVSVLLLLFLSRGCRLGRAKRFEITRVLSNATPGSKLYLQKWYYDSLPIVDSGVVRKPDQKITFLGDLSEEALFTLLSTDHSGSHLNIIVADTPVTVHIACRDSDWLASSITGSVAANLLRDNIMRTVQYGRRKKAINHRIEGLRYLDSSKIQIRKMQDTLEELHRVYTDQKIEAIRNSHSPVLSWWLLSTLQMDEGSKRVRTFIPMLKKRFQHSEMLHKYIRDYDKMIRPRYIHDSLPLAISLFTLASYDGKPISLAQVLSHNEYTLIDFWASWCAPCVAEFPYLTKAHDAFKGMGFEILSVSIDKKRTDWVSAVKKYDMDWPQLIVGESDSQVVKDYGVTLIPKNLLVDKDGEIIARNLRGESVVDALTSLFSKH